MIVVVERQRFKDGNPRRHQSKRIADARLLLGEQRSTTLRRFTSSTGSNTKGLSASRGTPDRRQLRAEVLLHCLLHEKSLQEGNECRRRSGTRPRVRDDLEAANALMSAACVRSMVVMVLEPRYSMNAAITCSRSRRVDTGLQREFEIAKGMAGSIAKKT